MIQISPQMRILVVVEPVDFRRGIDGLAQLCREVLKADPFSEQQPALARASLGPDIIYLQDSGCEEFTIRLNEVKPRLHIFGHIHDGYGYEDYQPVNPVWVVDLEPSGTPVVSETKPGKRTQRRLQNPWPVPRPPRSGRDLPFLLKFGADE